MNAVLFDIAGSETLPVFLVFSGVFLIFSGVEKPAEACYTNIYLQWTLFLPA